MELILLVKFLYERIKNKSKSFQRGFKVRCLRGVSGCGASNYNNS